MLPRSRPSPVFPVPETFNGTECDTWYAYMKAELDEMERLLAIPRRRIGSCTVVWSPRSKPGDLPTSDAALYQTSPSPRVPLCTWIPHCLHDSRASRKISQFNDESFTAYLARFERILYDAAA